jgi:hypothetical protein
MRCEAMGWRGWRCSAVLMPSKAGSTTVEALTGVRLPSGPAGDSTAVSSQHLHLQHASSLSNKAAVRDFAGRIEFAGCVTA